MLNNRRILGALAVRGGGVVPLELDAEGRPRGVYEVELRHQRIVRAEDPEAPVLLIVGGGPWHVEELVCAAPRDGLHGVFVIVGNPPLGVK